ncbi:DNA (cytosine-5-)-methyltransferase [Spirosoma sp. KCTC 42546]|uniref:DNA cytosine methyltransferase n=1 Tax=Spirosoma sp. KCTC 42546 TaxID=2520506 RepID=UPI001158A68D|nr:DNA (cytosine-5-)-methyltransferase [Spirosoma sp. KCTC 42546]QDK77155.1 DNA (cytosine-5-)-methyltransferase [Spirosoma sp. KCTC 42546]
MLTAVSLFSGCGGFDFGASKAGIKVIWANDVDKTAALAYKSLLPDVDFVQGDIRKVLDFPKADVLIGCYPCTGFSLAARRKWHEREDRNLQHIEGNFLYREFIRAIDYVRPKYLFIENVGGMTSADGGWFFKQQLEGLRDKGFVVKHHMLHSEKFGLAQTRKRVFLVGVHKDIAESGFTYNFPTATHGEKLLPLQTMYDVLNGVETNIETDVCNNPFHGHYLTRNRKRSWNDPSFTIVATDSHVPLHPAGEPMVKVGKDNWALQGQINRRLSWKECAIIQGFPVDKLKFDAPLTQKYKVIGNAVPPNFGYAIVKPVVEYEESTCLPNTFAEALEQMNSSGY